VWGSKGNYATLTDFGALPVAIDFYLSSYPGPAREVRGLRHKQGWLMLAEVNLETLVSSHSRTIVACSDLDGNEISSWLGSKLLDMRCSLPAESHYLPPSELDDIADALYWDFLGSCDLENLKILQHLETETTGKIDKLEERHQDLSSRAYQFISRLQRDRRKPDCDLETKRKINAKIDTIEDHLDRYEEWLLKQTQQIRSSAYELEQDILDSLKMEGTLRPLYTVQWRARTSRRGMELKLPLQQEERRNLGIDVNSEEAVRADVALRENQSRQQPALQNDGKPVPPVTWKIKLRKAKKADQEREVDHEKVSAMLAASLGFSGS